MPNSLNPAIDSAINQSPKTTRSTNAMKLAWILCLSFMLALLSYSQIQNAAPKTRHSKQTNKSSVKDGAKVQTNLPLRYSLGSKATQRVIAGWDIDVRPDGLGLPAGSGSVEDGEELYEDKCSTCHGSFGEGEDQWPKLAGGNGSLAEAKPKKTVGSFWPYASTLFDYINRAMPFPAPQSLKPDEVYAITAYVLNMNEIVDDDFVLTKENLTTVEMPNKDGFYVDDRPDTNNTRCMKGCKDPLKIKVILGPKYSRIKVAQEARNPALALNNLGKTIYESACKACHDTGVANAPKLGNVGDWTERLKQGKEAIYTHALNGFNGMPAKGGQSNLSDKAIKHTVDYMISRLN